MPALKIEGLTKLFGEHSALRGVDLTIAPGEFVTLLGPSGCGKTTTLRIVAGLERPSAGTLQLFGETVVDTKNSVFLPPNRRPLGMVFQSYALWPHMSALDNVAFPLRNRENTLDDKKSLSTAEINERAMNVLDLVQCRHLAGRYPGEMSGGQQQRIALARSIVHAPPLVLLDEPLSNLDARLRRDLRLELRRLQQDVGFAALYVTHDQSEALAMSDRVVLMREGAVEQIAAPRDMFEMPATSYAAGFIGDHNLLPGEITAVDEGTVSVLTSIGSLLAVPASDSVVPHVGSRATVALRTDRISIETDAEHPTATVLGAAYSGAYVDILFELMDSQRVTVRDYRGEIPPERGVSAALIPMSVAVLTQVDE